MSTLEILSQQRRCKQLQVFHFTKFLTKNRKICEGKEVCHCSDVALVLMTNESTQEIGEELYQDVRKGTTTLGVESYE
jgi:hypothetical protein